MKLICSTVFLSFLVFCAITAHAGTEPNLNLNITLGPKSLGLDYYQMAVWLEDEAGHYVETLYVTDATGKDGLGNSYMSFIGITLRSVPGSLPVWAHARGVLYGKSHYPPKDKPLPDAMTGATIKQEDVIKTFPLAPEVLAKLQSGTAVCCVEINVSRDSIPSMVFKGKLNLADKSSADLAFVGCGNEKGENGRITPGLPPDAVTADFIKTAQVAFEGAK